MKGPRYSGRMTDRQITTRRSSSAETDRLRRKAVLRGMDVDGTTAPEYTCVSLRERTSAHFVRLRTPDLGLTFVLD
jgi:hypothetical protein